MSRLEPPGTAASLMGFTVYRPKPEDRACCRAAWPPAEINVISHMC